MKTLEEIKQLMVAGDTVQADVALKELLAKEPDNLQAKMLYGTCRQLLGDEKTFKRIHDEIVMEMANKDATELQTETASLWRKYHALWMKLIVGGLVLAGGGTTAWYFGRVVLDMFGVSCVPVQGRHESALYAGPGYYENQCTDVTDRITPTAQKEFPRDAQSLYAGPGFDDKIIEKQ